MAHLAIASGLSCAVALAAAPYAEIRVVDAETGRGVPLVELKTVNQLLFVTDSAGRVAFNEPGLMGRELFFHVSSHGYEVGADGFGYRGARVTPREGEVATIKIKRTNVAERLYRLTGEGIYRDSVLLGHDIPLPDPLSPGLVAGQDSVQTTIYRDRLFWMWGDTSRMSYPLGLFRMAGATSPVPQSPADFEYGIPFEYFVGREGFARAMMPLAERPEGVIWIESLFVVPDEDQNDRLVGHYSRRKGLAGELEQGIAIFDDQQQQFEPVKQLPLDETWRRPRGEPVSSSIDGREYLVFGSPTPNVRVPATLADVLNPAAYEAFTCGDPEAAEQPLLGEGEQPVWRWQRDLPPVDSKTEWQWIRDKKLKPNEARYTSTDCQTGEPLHLVRGSVHFSEFRRKWIRIACQSGGGPSFLGEVWYSEADDPTGPFSPAVRVVTHDKMTFYNPSHHPFLDSHGGRHIHFEGTYCNTFSGNQHQTPRYDYNQILYRLDLAAPAIVDALGE